MSYSTRLEINNPSPAEAFPFTKAKIYAMFAAINFLAAIPRYFLVPQRGILFHGSLYIATIIWCVLTWEFILLSGRLLEKKLPAASHFLWRAIIQIILTYPVVTLLGDGMFYGASLLSGIPLDPKLVIIGYLLYFLMTMVLNLVYFGTIYFFNWKKELISLGGVQREQAIVKYDGLRNQLNPHFLFNALTSLNSLIFENQQLASDFLQQLSKVFRYTLQNKEKETVAVRTELEFIGHYIQLLKTRFTVAIDVLIDVPEEAMDRGIVPVTSQMLIENAVKHNIISMAHPLKISITATDRFFIVENSKNKKEQVETSNKQGLSNLKALYQYLSGIPVEIEDTDKTFIARIPLI